MVLAPTRVSGARTARPSIAKPRASSQSTAASGRPVRASAAVTTNRPPNSTRRCQSTRPSMVRVARCRLTRRQPATSSTPSTCGSGVANSTRRSSAATVALTSPGRSSAGGASSARLCAARKRVRHCHKITTKTQPRPATAGGAQAARNRQNSSPPTSPIRMFCGLPMIVAAEPALAPPASAMTNGRGSRPRRTSPVHSIGVIANTTTSLASTAARIPAATTVIASSAAGGRAAVAIRTEHQS
jgi:hypothetical protein